MTIDPPPVQLLIGQYDVFQRLTILDGQDGDDSVTSIGIDIIGTSCYPNPSLDVGSKGV